MFGIPSISGLIIIVAEATQLCLLSGIIGTVGQFFLVLTPRTEMSDDHYVVFFAPFTKRYWVGLC